MVRRLIAVAAIVAFFVAIPVVARLAPASADPLTKVLVFSKTTGFRHGSIAAGIAAIQALGTANGFSVTATEDAGQFTTANLAQFQAVVWLNTTGDVLDAAQQSAFESYIAGGGGYVGVHSAADTEYDWPWYGGLVGAYFASHPAEQQATIRVEDRTNPSTEHLGQEWIRTDEWYNYRTNPRAEVRVLLSLDESSYTGGSMGDHPITWCQNYDGGRSWYTGLGHTDATYSEPAFTQMLLGGIQVAAGARQADCSPQQQPAPDGTAIRALANGRLVSAEDNAPLIANQTTVRSTERFDIVDLGGGDVAIRSRANGKYVAAENAGADPLIANRTVIGPWERFQKIPNSDGTVSFKAQVNGEYVAADNAGADPLIANKTIIGPWEKFDLIAAPPDSDPISPNDYQQVQLAVGAAEMGEAMSLAIMPNRSVIHTARDGVVRVTDVAGNTNVAGTIPVYTHDEEGMQGIGVDPGFATNRFIWLYYSPPLSTPSGDAPVTGDPTTFAPWKGHLNLSRVRLNVDNTIDMASEKIVLQVESDRGQCCHVGGDIDFDAAGNIYLTTGDDTNPFASEGYSPIDERTDRNPQFDAQRSSSNTNDLRGKLLRIHPEADGTYTIPAGNMFPPGTPKTRPEIYAMGFRNPFRMSVDKPTGIVYLGDYGPDAGASDPDRGPNGQVEYTRITGPGFYGWPYCTGTNTTAETYNRYTFPSGPSGAKYDCAGGPSNTSFRNTGLTTLPPAKPSWIRYGGDTGSPPEFGSGSESPMGGVVYRYDAGLNSSVKFPQSLDGRYFAGEYGRRWIKAITVNADGSYGDIVDFPWSGTQVIDMAFGPDDGALYVVDYGTGSNNQALYRIEHIGGGNRSPIAKASADKTSGAAPLTVAFSSAGSSDPENGALSYGWDFGDGTSSTAANPTKTYQTTGTFSPTLTVTDPQGLTGTASLVVTVGNTAPTVTFNTPPDGQVFAFGDAVAFTVTVTDPEDGTVDCGRVTVTYLLGHDSHAHQMTSKTGCSGTINIPTDGEHDAAANLYGVLQAAYTDDGGLTGSSVRTLQPQHRQAEHFSTQSGTQLASHSGAEGGTTVGYIENGDWIAFQPYALGGVNQFTARVSSGGSGGKIEIRTGSPTGTLVGSVQVAPTGSWDTFTTVTTALSGVPAGTTTLYLAFTGGGGYLLDIDAFTLDGTAPPPPPGSFALRSQANGKYVSATNAGAGQLVATASLIGAAERFDVVDLGNGNVALRAAINNKYVCAENAGAAPLIANRGAVGPWETFQKVTNADGTISLLAAANTKYVVAENAGADPLIANRAAIGPWEKFTLVPA